MVSTICGFGCDSFMFVVQRLALPNIVISDVDAGFAVSNTVNIDVSNTDISTLMDSSIPNSLLAVSTRTTSHYMVSTSTVSS